MSQSANVSVSKFKGAPHCSVGTLKPVLANASKSKGVLLIMFGIAIHALAFVQADQPLALVVLLNGIRNLASVLRLL